MVTSLYTVNDTNYDLLLSLKLSMVATANLNFLQRSISLDWF